MKFISLRRLVPSRPFHRVLFLIAVLASVILVAWVVIRLAAIQHSSNLKISQPVGEYWALKIYTSEEGIYELKASDLEAAGLKTNELDDSKLSLSLKGSPLPLWKAGKGKELKLRFFARESQSIYSKENIYLLTYGNGTQNQFEGEGITSTVVPPVSLSFLPEGTYLEVTHLEQNKLYNPQVEEGDHWFWFSIPAPNKQSIEVDLSTTAPGVGRMQVMVWASTEAQASPDHFLVVRLNGQNLTEEKWDGKGRHTFWIDVPVKILKDGKNQVELEAPGIPGVSADITFLDWIKIYFPRRFTPKMDRLKFTSLGGELQLEGLSQPVTLVDVSHPMAPQLVEGTTSLNGTLQSQAGHTYWVVGQKGFAKPSRVAKAVSEPDLRDLGNGATYIAIGLVDLLEPLKPLLNWRAQQGLKVSAIPLDAVYDQFNAGFPEPEAIRAFLRYAVQNWQPAPHYVLLVGDATYDPRGYISSPEANRLPVFLVPTQFGGETASDLGYARLNDELWQSESSSPDSLPDLAVGRIPAQKPAQVSTLVQKILAYENGEKGDWLERVLAIADGNDSSFKGDAQVFLDLFPESYNKELFAPEAGVSDANQQISERLNRGEFLVAYFGHGSINMWGKDRLFTNEDVANLTDSTSLPVVLNMTCLTGLFTHPRVESLAEAFLWKINGGAVAVLAPTSLTLPNDQGLLSREVVNEMLKDPAATLGDILLRARQKVLADNTGTLDVIETFLLLGDPGLHLNHFTN